MVERVIKCNKQQHNDGGCSLSIPSLWKRHTLESEENNIPLEIQFCCH